MTRRPRFSPPGRLVRALTVALTAASIPLLADAQSAPRRPVDDPKYVMVNLEFDDVAGAESLLAMLRGRIWTNPETAPALVGQPTARIVDTVETL